MGKLEGKVAVITGAGSGMVRATAIRFAREGAGVVLTDLNSRGGEEAVAQCAAAGAKAIFQRTDVTSETDIKAAVERAVREFGRLDIMFNNAGIAGALGPIDKVKVEDWDRSMAVLLRAVFLGMKYSIPEMRKSGGGSIITTASVAGLRGVGFLAPYSAAKGAIVTLTQAVAIEVGRDRIRVNCICPGGVNTPLVHRGTPGGEQAAEERMAKMQPIPRRPSGRYRQHGAVSRQRRIRMDHRHRDGSRWRNKHGKCSFSPERIARSGLLRTFVREIAPARTAVFAFFNLTAIRVAFARQENVHG